MLNRVFDDKRADVKFQNRQQRRKNFTDMADLTKHVLSRGKVFATPSREYGILMTIDTFRHEQPDIRLISIVSKTSDALKAVIPLIERAGGLSLPFHENLFLPKATCAFTSSQLKEWIGDCELLTEKILKFQQNTKDEIVEALQTRGGKSMLLHVVIQRMRTAVLVLNTAVNFLQKKTRDPAKLSYVKNPFLDVLISGTPQECFTMREFLFDAASQILHKVARDASKVAVQPHGKFGRQPGIQIEVSGDSFVIRSNIVGFSNIFRPSIPIFENIIAKVFSLDEKTIRQHPVVLENLY